MASTMLLTAGACFFTTSGSFDRCALQPIECSSDQVFRSPVWLTANNEAVLSECSTQESIRKMNSLGRCNSISDRFICTSDATACRFQAVFSPLTQDCNLVNDFLPSNEFDNAHFGFCEGLDFDGKTDFCAWRFQECSDRHRWNIADTMMSASIPACHCDDVRTGACVHSTEDNTFCAVTPEVCDEDEGYIYRPVLDLESTLNITCKLCDVLLTLAAPEESDDEELISASTMLLSAGACFFFPSGFFDRCALQPIECSSDQVFRSPGWLTANNEAVLSECSTQESIRKMNSLGRCNSISDRFICTSDATACRFQAVFSPLTQDCNLVNDFLPSNEFDNAHFGFCEGLDGQTNFCAWRFQECSGRHQWNIADTFFASSIPDCHCDDVSTGACVHSTEDNTFCAVTPEVCDEDDGYIYRPVLDLESTLNITCKLCDVLLTLAAPEESDESVPSEDSDEPILGSEPEAKTKSTLTGATVSGGGIAGIVIGSLLGLVAIVTGLHFAVNHNLSSKENLEHVEDDPSINAPSVA